MSAAAKIAVGVASGYLLGRTKKLKLAITVGSMLAGQRIATDPKGLMKQGAKLVESNPELSKLSDQIRSQLFEAARAAAMATATSRMNGLSDAIRDRSERLALPAVVDDLDEDEDAYDEDEDAYDEDEAPEDEAEEEEAPDDEYDEDQAPEDEAEE
ncbi:MAG: hypothetical protein ACXVW2_04460, partial [Nocardioidaceae bacterium]